MRTINEIIEDIWNEISCDYLTMLAEAGENKISKGKIVEACLDAGRLYMFSNDDEKGIVDEFMALPSPERVKKAKKVFPHKYYY